MTGITNYKINPQASIQLAASPIPEMLEDPRKVAQAVKDPLSPHNQSKKRAREATPLKGSVNPDSLSREESLKNSLLTKVFQKRLKSLATPQPQPPPSLKSVEPPSTQNEQSAFVQELKAKLFSNPLMANKKQQSPPAPSAAAMKIPHPEKPRPLSAMAEESDCDSIDYDPRVTRWFTNPEETLQGDYRTQYLEQEDHPKMIWQHAFSKAVDPWALHPSYGITTDFDATYHYMPAIITRPGQAPEAMELQYTFSYAGDGSCFHRYCKEPTDWGTSAIWERFQQNISAANSLAGEGADAPRIIDKDGTVIQLLDLSQLG